MDPLGGSWYVESLTDDLERQALEYIRRIDDLGGAVSAIEDGFQMRGEGGSAMPPIATGRRSSRG